jgi:hypothetical protein
VCLPGLELCGLIYLLGCLFDVFIFFEEQQEINEYRYRDSSRNVPDTGPV